MQSNYAFISLMEMSTVSIPVWIRITSEWKIIQKMKTWKVYPKKKPNKIDYYDTPTELHYVDETREIIDWKLQRVGIEDAGSLTYPSL